VFSLSFLRVLFSDLSKELSLFYLASFILYVISRVLVSDLASFLSSGSRTADRPTYELALQTGEVASKK
jgi:hypothetical protein